MPLTSRIGLSITASHTIAYDLATAGVPLGVSKTIALASGTGADQADVIWHDTQAIAAATDIDVAGALEDALGTAYLPVKLKALYIEAAAANDGNIVFGGDANSALIFDAVADSITLKPGQIFLTVAPGAAGICTVVADTGDILQFTPSAGTQTFSIVLIGTSA